MIEKNLHSNITLYNFPFLNSDFDGNWIKLQELLVAHDFLLEHRYYKELKLLLTQEELTFLNKSNFTENKAMNSSYHTYESIKETIITKNFEDLRYLSEKKGYKSILTKKGEAYFEYAEKMHKEIVLYEKAQKLLKEKKTKKSFKYKKTVLQYAMDFEPKEGKYFDKEFEVFLKNKKKISLQEHIILKHYNYRKAMILLIDADPGYANPVSWFVTLGLQKFKLLDQISLSDILLMKNYKKFLKRYKSLFTVEPLLDLEIARTDILSKIKVIIKELRNDILSECNKYTLADMLSDVEKIKKFIQMDAERQKDYIKKQLLEFYLEEDPE